MTNTFNDDLENFILEQVSVGYRRLKLLAKEFGTTEDECRLAILDEYNYSQNKLKNYTNLAVLGGGFLLCSSTLENIPKKNFLKALEGLLSLTHSIAIAGTMLNREVANSRKFSAYARKGQAERPVGKAKDKIKNDFLLVRNKFTIRGYGKSFVDEMESKYPEIQNRKTIERLVAKLKKQYPLF